MSVRRWSSFHSPRLRHSHHRWLLALLLLFSAAVALHLLLPPAAAPPPGLPLPLSTLAPSPGFAADSLLQRLRSLGISIEVEDGVEDARVWKAKLRYPWFRLPKPGFLTPEHRVFAAQHPRLQEWESETKHFYAQHPLEKVDDDQFILHGDTYTYGEVVLLSNVTVKLPFDCSYERDYHQLLHRSGNITRRFRSLAFLKVAQAWSFQHFMDGALPRVSQAWELIEPKNVTVLTNPLKRKFPIVRRLWERLGKRPEDESLITINEKEAYFAEHVLISCQPWHPFLWRRGPELLGVKPLPYDQRDRIVYISRSRGKIFNSGRRVVNELQLLEGIAQWLVSWGRTEELVFADEAPSSTLEETFQFWSRAKVIIGPHGGGLYNLNWAGSNTLVVELSPAGSSKPSLWIFYMMSAALGQRYYHIPCTVTNAATGDMSVEVSLLQDLLRSAL